MFNGKKLGDYLREQNLSQRSFGDQIGVSGVMVGYLVEGKKQPSLIIAKRIADAMGTTLDSLVV